VVAPQSETQHSLTICRHCLGCFKQKCKANVVLCHDTVDHVMWAVSGFNCQLVELYEMVLESTKPATQFSSYASSATTKWEWLDGCNAQPDKFSTSWGWVSGSFLTAHQTVSQHVRWNYKICSTLNRNRAMSVISSGHTSTFCRKWHNHQRASSPAHSSCEPLTLPRTHRHNHASSTLVESTSRTVLFQPPENK